MKVNFVDLGEQYALLKEGIMADFDYAVSNGSFMGAQEFEEKFADYNGTSYCVGVGSGTDALWLSLLAYGIGPGDEVIVPANTYIATALAVSHTGATPVFIDPNPDTYVIETDKVLEALTDKTKAIIPVHLYGHPVDMAKMMDLARDHNLVVIEDCAQSAGGMFANKKTGSWGHVGCYSFYPTKNLGGLGQGGAIVTDDADVATTVRELGNVGRAEGSWFDYAHKGFNSRLDAVNARFLNRGLDMLDEWNMRRGDIALEYDALLEDTPLQMPPIFTKEELSVFHLFEVKCPDKETRDALKEFLNEKEIACALHYPVPCHKQPIYSDISYECPISEALADELLSLPMHPNLTKEEITYVCDSIKEFFNK